MSIEVSQFAVLAMSDALAIGGIAVAILAAQTHMEVMESPDRISRSVLARGLDANTAFEIVSIDIADIDVGDNIGAR